jgi:MFS family permease
LPLARHMPAFVDSRSEPNADAVEMSVPYKSVALLGVLAYNIAQGIAWAYLFLIGTHAGIAEQHVANALTISQMIAIVGALTALMLGSRFGRSGPLLVGIAGGAASLVPLMGQVSLGAYTLAVCGFNYLWNMVLPYILASVASYDRRGMIVVYAVAAQMIGLGLGPAVGAYAVTGEGFDRTLELSFGLFVLSLALLIIPLWRHASIRAAMIAGPTSGCAGIPAATSPSTEKSSA